VTVFCLFGLLLADPGHLQALRVPEDLDLDRAPTVMVRSPSGPNPHDALPCAKCHEETDLTYETAEEYGIKVPLKTEGDSTILLCEECHLPYPHSFHPVNIRVTKSRGDDIERTGTFPLETPLEGIDKLTCITCHDVHFPHTRNRLLRGFSVVPEGLEGKFLTRIEFCSSCHGEETRLFSSHWGRPKDRKCNLCHLGMREPGVPGDLKSGVNESCVICHPLPRGELPHFYSYNPFPDFRRDELAGYGLVLEKGRFTCTTCHTHHRPEDDAGFLRPSFVNVVSKSLRVNPHRTTRFCRNCHPVRPPPVGTSEAVAPLWEEDVTRLCRGCHTKKGALKMFHPLAAVPPEAMIPEGWPRRKDGSLGCQTCHLAGHGPPDPSNIKMLRGAVYRERNDICFRCHEETSYERRNIHAETVDFRGCEFCHIVKERTALRPEGKVGDLLAEPTLLCLLCHDAPPHPASHDHTVRPGSLHFVSYDAEVTPLTMGKITCHSCHDAHSTDQENRFLRGSGPALAICRNCHPF
jgi:predicted CXXCH cytochrome family protein